MNKKPRARKRETPMTERLREVFRKDPTASPMTVSEQLGVHNSAAYTARRQVRKEKASANGQPSDSFTVNELSDVASLAKKLGGIERLSEVIRVLERMQRLSTLV